MIAPVLPVRRDVGNGERFQYLRAWRPGGWTPEIDIVGTDHVSAALAQGSEAMSVSTILCLRSR
jgi:hypothetical protein